MSTRRTNLIAAFCVVVFSFHLNQAFADVIIQPVSATAEQVGPIENTIDQSGLSSPYTSGVTDFANFVSTVTHDDTIQTVALFDPIFPQSFTFDLGTQLPGINGFALWSNLGSAGIRDFDLFADNDGDLGNGGTTLLGSFTAADISHVGQSFGFGPVTTQYVHLTVNNYYGSLDLEIGEMAFSQQVIPEPTAIGLLPLVGLAIFCRRKRR